MTEHVNVLIVGGGLSGIGAGVHIQTGTPDKTFAILEARDAIGGTWDLFRYPGIRSDSDMYTLGFKFKPWTHAKAIADGHDILQYIQDTAAEHHLHDKIRLGHRVKRTTWSPSLSRWTVEIERGPERERVVMTCDFLFLCAGYYNYEAGFTPQFPGIDRFKGEVVHPQKWTSDIDHAGKRVVVIGSGATAVTLVPSMTDKAKHVTMLQRSPTYIMALPGEDAIAHGLRAVLPAQLAYDITRWKNVLLGMLFFNLSRRYPNFMKKLLIKGVQRFVGDNVDVSKHFTPSYNPWDQRVCAVPDADLFKALRKGTASVVTDHIETFTEHGIQLQSGEQLQADMVVTATGLDLLAFGGIEMVVDGQVVKPAETMSYKGMMLAGVPNLAYVVGYTNASWTLKADLTCEYVCRLLRHMDRLGVTQVEARRDPNVQEENWINFNSGYILRSLHLFPKQGDRKPWKLNQNYILDLFNLRLGAVDDGAVAFSGPSRVSVQAQAEALSRQAA